MTTPRRDSTPSPELNPATDALRQRIIEETRKRTGKTPYDWQVQVTLDKLAGKDTFVIAGTGAGKSLTFAMVPFMVPKSITWLLAPLNYIEEQLVKDMEKWGVPAVAINQNSNWEEEKRNILRGKYQVVISSPEAFLSVDRLRNILTSPELEGYQHFGTADEAHVIHTWGTGFRVDYGRVGNLRAIIYNVPFSAVTATATPAIKKSIIECLHLGKQRELAEINLGNYRDNIEYSVHLMKGGSESYEELFQFFPDPNNIPKTLIFVDRTHDTHVIATKLRKHLGIEGTPHWDKVRPYHANRAQSGKDRCAEDFKNGKCNAIPSTEALTMGANFDDVELVIQLPAPNSAVTHVQRIGRGGRTSGTRCRGVMMVTPNQYQRAIQLCADIKDMQPDDLLNAKVEEEDLDELEGVLAGEQTQATDNNGAMDEPSDEDAKKSSKTGLRAINLHVARFITTKTCRTKVLDDIFKNPEHISCYEAGTCDLCVARRARDEAANETDTHTQERALKREEIEVQLDARGEAIEEPKRKRAPRADNRTGKELQRFVDRLKQWRRKVFRAEAETGYLGIEDIMTDKAMEAIAKCKSIKNILDLDRLEPPWPQRVRWGGEVVGIVLELTGTIEEEKHKATEAEQEQKEAERREKDERRKAEKEAKRLAQQQEREAKRATNVPRHTPTSNIHTPPQAGPSNQTPGGSFGPAIVAQSPARVVIGPDGRSRAILATPTSHQVNSYIPVQQQATPHTPPIPRPPPFARSIGYSTPTPHPNPAYMAHPPPYIPRPPFAYSMPYVTPQAHPRAGLTRLTPQHPIVISI
ncbi:Bloom syndrome protein homolog [Rhizoctonia solani]|uniref:DNA 3'-5' helicase n=1 Tax=Rhizoctonia solani TaxID=456999 RepID=A0A0K6FZE1_9AGAM|nr:Bloom syndrome protein homolog [Rhizoctonia solani]